MQEMQLEIEFSGGSIYNNRTVCLTRGVTDDVTVVTSLLWRHYCGVTIVPRPPTCKHYRRV